MDWTINITAEDKIAASSVALFGCDTFALASQYSDADFTGVQSGLDGTDLSTLDQAAASWVNAGGGDAGDIAANAAIEKSHFSIDTGDNVESERPGEADDNE